MPRTLQFKRYGTLRLANTAGANGELIVDSTTKTLTVHDGTTLGGSRLASESYVQTTTGIFLAQAAFNRANTASSNTVLLQGAMNTANSSINAAAQTVPQNAQTTNYTLQTSDAGKHIYYTQASNTTLYIPWSSNASFSNGTTIMIISRTSSSANVTVSPNTGVTMYLAGNTTSASRNVTTYGMATLIQVAANTWFINGTGIV
jgi:hypothetical protein